jgi:hypothetical protein
MTQVSPADPAVGVVSVSISIGLPAELHGSDLVSERPQTAHRTISRRVPIEGCAPPPDA